MGFLNYFIEDKDGHVPDGIDTIIGKKAHFKGELSTKGSVCVNGRLEGKINTDADLIIASGSKIVGNISGGNVVVSGNVEGNITAVHNLEIKKSGRVHGDLEGGRIVIEEGSSYRGRVKVKSTEPVIEESVEEPAPPSEENQTEVKVEQEPQTHMFSNV